MANPIGCLDPGQMIQALAQNTISKTQFDNWVSNYFHPGVVANNPDPKLIPVNIMKIISNYGELNCNICIKVSTTDPNVSDNNDDIQVENETILNAAAQVVPLFTRYYDITLFNAIFNILDPIMPIDSFGFTKANKLPLGKEGGSSLDLIFVVNSKNGNTTYWDLSTTVPPPPKIN